MLVVGSGGARLPRRRIGRFRRQCNPIRRQTRRTARWRSGIYKQHSKIACRLASDRREDRHGPAPSYSDYHVPTALKGGVGLSRVMLVAESRCHFGSFNLTTFDPDGRASLAQSLNDLPCANQPIAPSQCRFASKIMQLPSIFFRAPHRPPPAQSLRSVPVRIIIGVDGRARNIHVIRASAEQRESITAALTGWQFRPFTVEAGPSR